jgi:HKD family nuclease
VHIVPLAPNLAAPHRLLDGVRRAIGGADEAILCVAFASRAGVALVENELRALAEKKRVSLLVTTTFGTTTPAALARAAELGVDVRVLNPSGGTYHPKVYLGRHDDQVRAVVGSANLTGGLVSNIEFATLLEGEMQARELAITLEWTRDLWSSSKALEIDRGQVEEECFSPEVFAMIREVVAADPVVRTLKDGKPNRIVDVSDEAVYVETNRSKERGGRPKLIPAWMIMVAWDVLRARGSMEESLLTNKELVEDFQIHRSSFVLALLARFPGVVAVKAPMGVRLGAG